MKSYPLRAGWGRVDVTPTESVPLHGYGNTERRMSQGNLDTLYVTCIAFTDEQENTVLLYTMDQLLTPRPVWEAAAQELSRRYGIPTSAVIIASTHTHSGPDMYQPLAESSARYRQVVADALLTAADQAMADRKPASLEIGRTHTEGMNFVRSYFMGDHTVAGDNMGNFVDNEVWDHATKPDTEVQLIKVVREGGKDILMVNWQVHAKLASTADTELGRARRPYASADLIGVCRDAVEEETDLLFAFFLGGAGNLNPLSRIPEENPVLDHLVYGRELAKVVVAGLDQLKPMATDGPVASKDSVLRGRCNHTEDHLAEKAREIAAMWQKDNNYRQCKAAGEPYGIHSPYHALLILRKLRYPIQKPMPLTQYYPSRISGFIAFALTFVYSYTVARPLSNETAQNILQSAGICGVIYLIFFGYIALLMVSRVYFRLPKAVGMLLTIFICMTLSYIPIMLGFAYISTGLHEALDARMSGQK